MIRRATAGYGNANEGNAEIEERGGKMVGLGRLELPTSPLSGVRSSHLSYRPNLLAGNILRDLRRSSNNGGASVAHLAGLCNQRMPATTCHRVRKSEPHPHGIHKKTVIRHSEFGL